jgi:hypothetical protein
MPERKMESGAADDRRTPLVSEAASRFLRKRPAGVSGKDAMRLAMLAAKSVLRLDGALGVLSTDRDWEDDDPRLGVEVVREDGTFVAEAFGEVPDGLRFEIAIDKTGAGRPRITHLAWPAALRIKWACSFRVDSVLRREHKARIEAAIAELEVAARKGDPSAGEQVGGLIRVLEFGANPVVTVRRAEDDPRPAMTFGGTRAVTDEAISWRIEDLRTPADPGAHANRPLTDSPVRDLAGALSEAGIHTVGDLVDWPPILVEAIDDEQMRAIRNWLWRELEIDWRVEP